MMAYMKLCNMKRKKIWKNETRAKKAFFMSLHFIMTIDDDKIIWFSLLSLNTGTCYGNITEVAKGQYYAKI